MSNSIISFLSGTSVLVLLWVSMLVESAQHSTSTFRALGRA